MIEKILRHCGLWQPSTPRPPPTRGGWPDFCGVAVHGEGVETEAVSGSLDWSDPDDFSASSTASPDEPGDWTYVDIDTFESNTGEFAADFEYETPF